MRPTTLLRQLDRWTRAYGPGAERQKLALLRALDDVEWTTRQLLEIRDHMNFLRAYPDSPRIRRRVEAWFRDLRARLSTSHTRAHANHGLPGSHNTHPFAHGVAAWLVRHTRIPASIDWDDWDDDSPLLELLAQLTAGVESLGVEDITITLPEWFEQVAGRREGADLALTLRLLEAAPLSELLRSHLFDSCGIPIRVPLTSRGTAVGEVALPAGRTRYQKAPLDRTRPLFADGVLRTRITIRRGSVQEGERWIDAARRELTARNLEIYPLTYANPRDAHVVDAGDALRVHFFGVLPAYRPALECLFSFLVVQNGVPLAYGPATSFLGQSEMGINLFPEFRGGEIGRYYGAVGAALHRLLGVNYFYLTRYGMGEGNEDAIRTGAFWFYRKLGFRPTNPEVEARAQREEERMRRRPGHRSGPAMLHALSQTEAYVDLLDRDRRPLAYGAVGMAVSRRMEVLYGRDRARGQRECLAIARRRLGLGAGALRPAGAEAALQNLAPLLANLPGLGRWPEADRRLLTRFVRAKGSPSEVNAARLSTQLPRLETELHQLLK